MMITIGVLELVMYLAIAAALIQKFRRSKDFGFVWLGLALVILPLLRVPYAFWLKSTVDRLTSGRHVGFFPFTLVERGEMTIGSLFAILGSVQHLLWLGVILVAILMLYKAKARGTPRTAQ